VHPPHFTEHGAERQREPRGQEPSSRLTDGGVGSRGHESTVQAEEEDRRQTHSNPEQHYRVAHRMRRLDHPGTKRSDPAGDRSERSPSVAVPHVENDQTDGYDDAYAGYDTHADEERQGHGT
jgi:hypothetical protein